MPQVAKPSIALVVSTIGRRESLDRLMTSLRALEDPSALELVLVDQANDKACTRYLQEQQWPFAVTTATSPKGLSIGRNAGLTKVQAPLVTFPDDDCYYLPDTLRRAISTLQSRPDIAGVSGIQLTPAGDPSMIRWPKRGRPITKWNYHRTAISSTMFMRTTAVRRLGGFDPDLGAGSAKGYLSGEESDLLLRMLEAGLLWRYDPALVVLQDDPRDEPTSEFVTKMAGYGRGFGSVASTNAVPRTLFVALLARKAIASAIRRVRGDRELATADWEFLHSAVEGYRSGRNKNPRDPQHIA